MTTTDATSIKTRIIDTARELFDSKGFDTTSHYDLIEALAINEQIFFSYFPSMDELLEVIWSGP